jgi:hypothetical protein
LRSIRAGEGNDDDNDNEPLPEPEADDDEPEIDPALRNDKGKGVDMGEVAENTENTKDDENKADDRAEEIQILQLHSQHPIISYKGRVFVGSWAEIIGTEAIFVSRENDRPLPALRHLDGNVDFLGASASRIATKEYIVKPKNIREDPLAAIKQGWDFRIPVGKDKSGDRSAQTGLLETIAALKKRKGETGQVTVWAQDGEGQDFKDKRDPDYKPRRRRRLLNEDGEEVIPKREKRRASGRRGGRPRLRTGRVRGTAAEMMTSATSKVREGQSAARGGNLSTPTPSRWNELHGRDDEEMDQEDDQSMTEDDEDEDMSIAD